MVKSRPQILVVDDEIYKTQMYIEALKDDGFQVTSTASVDEALEIAKSQKFNVVLLDVMMPPGEVFNTLETEGGFATGKTLARELRSILPEAKLIALTSSTDPEIKAWFSRDDCFAYLNKAEILCDELPRSVRRILQRGVEPPQAFIVHGRDQQSLLELKDFLQNQLGFSEPIVLAEQASRGLTLIEKFEHYAAKAELVFVMLTPDDVGSLADEAMPQRRARQNAVFELGFFLGALRRKSGRVFLLAKGDIEVPSDLSGLVRIDITGGISSAAESLRVELGEFILNEV